MSDQIGMGLLKKKKLLFKDVKYIYDMHRGVLVQNNRSLKAHAH